MATFQNLSLGELMSKLQDLHERRVDLVVPSQLLTMRDTDLRITHPDFVKHFASADHFASGKYLMNWLSDIREQGSYRLQHPVSCTENVTSNYEVTQKDTQSILEYFSRSGQNTAFGIAQAVTFHAQQVGDADLRNDLKGYADDMLTQIPRWDRREKINHGTLDRSAMPRTEVSGGRHFRWPGSEAV